jgi:hypothetical protein
MAAFEYILPTLQRRARPVSQTAVTGDRWLPAVRVLSSIQLVEGGENDNTAIDGRSMSSVRYRVHRVGLDERTSFVFSLHLLEIPLHDEMLDIGAADHEPLPLLKIDRAQLCLYRATIAHDAHERM